MRLIIEKEIERQNIKKSHIAKKIGVSNSSITNLMTGKQEPEFETVLNTIRLLKPEIEEQVMSEFFTEIKKTKNIVSALEYASTHRMQDSFQLLIDKAKQVKNNKDLVDIVKVYKLQYNYQFDVYQGNDLINKIRETQVCNEYASILLTLLESYYYYENTDYKMVKTIIDGLMYQVEKLPCEYIKRSFKGRIYQILAYISLKIENNPEKCRKYSEKLLQVNIGRIYNTYANYMIGLTYARVNYEKAIHYIEISRIAYQELGREKDASIMFHKSNLIKFWNNKLTAQEVLDLYHYDHESPEYYLLNGVIQNSKDMVMISFSKFLQQGDVFLSTLSKEYLLKMGESEAMLNEIQKIISIN